MIPCERYEIRKSIFKFKILRIMGKITNILITVFSSIASFACIILIVRGDYKINISGLHGIGNLLLFIVEVAFGFILLSLIVFIPFVIFKGLRESGDDKKQVMEVGKYYAIIFVALSIFAIAGSLLRGLN